MIDCRTSHSPPVDVTAMQGSSASHEGSFPLSSILDEIDCGLIVSDCQGVLHYANRPARAEMQTGRVLSQHGNRLRGRGIGTATLELALRQAVSKGRRQLVVLSSVSDLLLVSVAPFRSADSEPPLVMIALGRRRACSELGLELLATAYRLTLAERRVLRDLATGKGPQEIATSHRVAISTVRTQIASLRTKLDVSSVEDLLLFVAGVPPLAGGLQEESSAHPALMVRGQPTRQHFAVA